MEGNDYAACAEVCDEHGFNRQAELLRAAGDGRLRLFAVVERVRDGDQDLLYDEGGEPRSVHLDRESAERNARRRNLRAFRERDLFSYAEGYIRMISDLEPDELSRSIAGILGVPFTMPDADTHPGSFFPASASDAQIGALMELFTIRFFYVAEMEFAG